MGEEGRDDRVPLVGGQKADPIKDRASRPSIFDALEPRQEQIQEVFGAQMDLATSNFKYETHDERQTAGAGGKGVRQGIGHRFQ